jgi:hypothetical protein
MPPEDVQRGSDAHGVVPGCPDGYNLMRASAFLQNNDFLYGRPRVHVNVPASEQTSSLAWLAPLSRLCPAAYYALLQRHVRYNRERLTSKGIAREASTAAQCDHLREEGESEGAFQSRVWRLLTRMRGDQKWYSLRFGAWLCTHIFQWLFNGEIYVRPQATAALRTLADNSTFVYAPFLIWHDVHCPIVLVQHLHLCIVLNARLTTYLPLPIACLP